MFRAWVFTEMPYPYIPPEDTFESVRVVLPNRHYDPELGFQLYRKYFDIYRAADELGLDIMVNEHHSTATCVEPACPLSMAILARETTRARLLALGNPVANRRDPLRVAEEMAMVDVISQGRAEVGFVRGVPQELAAGNSNPVDMKERFWEAADLIIKAWTTHDGPFNWEGDHFHHRQVNIWPRVYQEPHPPVWVPTQTVSTASEVGERGYTVATILNGVDGARKIFDSYRRRALESGRAQPGPEQFAYLGLVFVGEDDREGDAGARKLQWYLQHNKVAPQFMDVPGYVDRHVRAAMMEQVARGDPLVTPVAHLAHASIDDLTKDGYCFAGSPDTVLNQLRDFYERVGGFGHFLMMVQGGSMGYELTTKSMGLFAQEVLPRFRAELDRATGLR
jgi:alkanesulfonate monooxygenase SsuD/methylene tetrahydromethanopterin reductase-like flavin-dependent oxidoreductase (luciferase family)